VGATAPIPHIRVPGIVQTFWWGSDPFGFYRRYRKKYGSWYVMKIVPFGDVYVTDDPEAIAALFRPGSDNLNAGEANGSGDMLMPLVGPRSVLLLDGAEHLRHRKLLLPPFHGDRMRAYEEVMRQAARDSIADWPIGRAFPLRPRMQGITLDVILRAVFGVRGDERRDRFRVAIAALLDFGGEQFLLAPPFRRNIGRPMWRRFARDRKRLDALLFEEIAERRAAGDAHERDDVLSMLVAAGTEDGAGLTDQELRDELVTLLTAGHETTATALAWTIELLFRNPEKRATLEAELAANDGTQPASQASTGDAYLRAVVDESLRVRPVVFDFARKTTAPARIGGRDVPAGALIGPASILVNANPDVYDDPLSFRPERWLDGARPPQASFITFGGGVRRCIGAAFAQFEIRVVLSEILTTTKLRPASKRAEHAVVRTVTTAPARGVRAIRDA
jgi:cytochrome P450